jgi:molecular chaperone GrpE (heat shock protein)
VTTPASGAPFPGATDATVDDLVAGLIAAHDLACASGPGGSEGGVAVQVQLERTLRGAGVDRVVVARGDVFDPDHHLAVATEPTPLPELDRLIAREVRAGWRTAGGVLRPVEVVVWMLATP